MRNLIIFLTIGIGICVINSCDKDPLMKEIPSIEQIVSDGNSHQIPRSYSSETHKTFFSFDTHGQPIESRVSVDSFVLNLNEALYQLNEIEDYVTQFSEQLGFPDWNNVINSSNELAWIPMMKENELHGLLGAVIINNTLYIKPFLSSYYKRFSHLQENQNVQAILSIIQYFETGRFNINSHGGLHIRGCPPPPCYYVDVYDKESGMKIHDICECSGQLSLPGCCNESNDGTPEDDGTAEAGWGIDISTWLALINNWNNHGTVTSGNYFGGSGSVSINIARLRAKLLRDLANEQYVIDWIIDYLDLDLTNRKYIEYAFILSGNPQIANPIYLYLNGFNGGPVIEDRVMSLLDFLVIYYPNIDLEEEEIAFLLTNDISLLEKVSSFLDQEGVDDFTLSSAEIIVGLASHDLLNATLSELESHEDLLTILIHGSFDFHGLNTRLSISSAGWYQMSQAIWNDPNNPISDEILKRLKAVTTAITSGWDWIQSKKQDLTNYLSSLQDQFPQNPEEWEAFWSIISPILLELGVDIGTDFIPIVGEIKALKNAIIAFNQGKYGEASFEVLAGIAGILPIGDILSAGGKIIKGAKRTFKALKVIKALAKVSSSIWLKIKSLTLQGWKFIWKDGLGKFIVKNDAGKVVGEIDEFGVPKIGHKAFMSIIDPGVFKHLNPKALANNPSGNSISKSFINEKANKFNVSEPSLKSKFNDIVQNGDNTYLPPDIKPGSKTEKLIAEIIEDGGNSGWTHYDGSYNGGTNGFDGVFIKGDEVIINESKQWIGGSVSLTGQGAGDPPWPAQMTDDWIDEVIEKLRIDGKEFVADKIEQAKSSDKLTKIVTVVDRTPTGSANNLTGGINIIKVIDNNG